ncbi:MAG TPA: TonB-dependent receptor [Flavisolibacter sp.]|jgi:TonB-linked SusC/RagA family outer membrane protein|nr:TonB-dependent receptor [Flavisolibacter sp.]
MRKFLTLLLGVLLFSVQVLAQTRTITGKVTDANGVPISGASVQVKGTNVGTVTQEDGTFSLSVAPTARTLTISAVGQTAREVNIGTQTNFTVTLQAGGQQNLQEVVVVGYGTQKRADLTGAVATVKAADIENKPFTSVDKALQGQVAGLQSVAASGQPGSTQAILIRGVSSITASNAPLWVIDGIPINTGDASRLSTTSNLLSTLNPNDIESISVLKDAASQSIYGSRAANGVIVVTTKRGRAGKTRFRFDTEVGKSDIAYRNERYRPLNADEYFTITREGLVNLGLSAAQQNTTLTGLGLGNGVDFNWLDATTRRAGQQQYNLSAEGGNERTTFYISGGYFEQEGTTINSKLRRTSGNFRINHKVSERVNFGMNMNGGFVNQRAPLAGGAFGNPVLSSYFTLPSRNPYNADGSYNLNATSLGGLHNTIALSELDKRYLREFSLRGNIFVEIGILQGLNFRSSFSGDFNNLEEDQYNNPFHGDGQASNGRAFAYYTRYMNKVWTNTLRYNRALNQSGDFNLNAQIGYEAQKSSGYFSSLQSQGFPPTFRLTYPSAGATPITANATISDYSFVSQFASANFNYQNRFVVSGSFRRDGSSRFGGNNRYGNFWSVGASWNIDREGFMQGLDLFSQLKLRTSYGVNGNAGIGNYDWLPLYGYGANYNGQPGSIPTNVGDSSLTWELNKPFNVGIDFGILRNRINVTADFYTRKSEDLLLDVPLSRTTGFSTATRNIGAMKNTGFEFAINAIPVQNRNFNWIVDLNFATNKNEILSLPEGNDIIQGSFILREGESINSFYLRDYAGVDPANGDPLWYLTDDKSTTTNNYSSAARVIAGTSLPKYFGSFTNTFNYKGISLEAQLYYNYGNYVQDPWGGYYVGAGFGATYNKVARVLERWQKPGDVTDIPKYIANGNKSFQSGSTFYLAKGDFIRLRNIQLGYNLPKDFISKISLTNAFIYVRGTNLATWATDENLPWDPEQGTASQSNLNVFIPKTVTIGLNVGF